LINEIIEVQEILKGKKVNDKCLYRTCYLLAKWFDEHNKTHIETRQEIFKWANTYGYWINYDLNSIIFQAFKDKRRLTDNLKIYINQYDIDEINNRFDRRKTKLVAFSILCYAKAFANSKKEFSLSVSALSDWIHVNQGDISSKFIPELINFEYINKIQNNNSFTWNKTIKSKSLDLKILVSIENSGEYCLEDNNINELFNNIFK